MKRKAFQNIEAIRNKLSQQKGKITFSSFSLLLAHMIVWHKYL